MLPVNSLPTRSSRRRFRSPLSLAGMVPFSPRPDRYSVPTYCGCLPRRRTPSHWKMELSALQFSAAVPRRVSLKVKSTEQSRTSGRFSLGCDTTRRLWQAPASPGRGRAAVAVYGLHRQGVVGRLGQVKAVVPATVSRPVSLLIANLPASFPQVMRQVRVSVAVTIPTPLLADAVSRMK